MKAVMIAYNQSISEEVEEILESLHIKGYTRWLDVQGRGSEDGEPHMGSHVWPSLNNVILTVVDNLMVEPILEKVREVGRKAEAEGIRAFVWDIEQMV